MIMGYNTASICVLAVCQGAVVVSHVTGCANDFSWSISIEDAPDCSFSGQNYEADKSYSQCCSLPAGDYVLSCVDSSDDGWEDGSKVTVAGIDMCENVDPSKQESTFAIGFSGEVATVTLTTVFTDTISLANELKQWNYGCRRNTDYGTDTPNNPTGLFVIRDGVGPIAVRAPVP